MPNLKHLGDLFSTAEQILKDFHLHKLILILCFWTYMVQRELFSETQLVWIANCASKVLLLTKLSQSYSSYRSPVLLILSYVLAMIRMKHLLTLTHISNLQHYYNYTLFCYIKHKPNV